MAEEACTKSELEVFAPIPIQMAMTSHRWMTYYPLNSLGNADVLEFIIPGTSNEVIDMNNTSIYIKAKITDDKGADLADTVKVQPINNLLAGLFRYQELNINGQLVTRASRETPYKDQLIKLTQYDMNDNGSLKGQNDLCGFKMDTVGKGDAHTTNTNGLLRAVWIAESKSFELRGKPCIDQFDCERNMIPGMDMQLKFYLNDPTFYLVDPVKTNKFKLKLEEVQLYVRRVTIGDTFVNEISSGLKTRDAIYPFTRREMVSLSMAQGITSFTKENLFRGQLATRYMIVLVDADAFTGSIEKTPFNFKHFDISEIALYENGQSVGMHQPLRMDIKAGKVANIYYTFLETIGAIGDRALNSPISLEQFSNGNTIFAFTRSPDLTHGITHLPNQTGNLTLQMSFKNALPNAVVCICMAEFDSRFQITQYKNVITDYAV